MVCLGTAEAGHSVAVTRQPAATCEVPFFQLRTVHLPAEFEDAIKETQAPPGTGRDDRTI